jgi:hypothetical protein
MCLQALKSAWNDEYCGDYHRLLFQNINALELPIKPYSNQIAIIQSSGTGKSRMVHEQANIVFTLPFNLRDRQDDNGFVIDVVTFLDVLTNDIRSGLPAS